jgi:hypothetical protein
MITILIWLGSGFAFAIGFFLGAFAMRWLNREDSLRHAESKRYYKLTGDLLAERNHILHRTNELLGELCVNTQKNLN